MTSHELFGFMPRPLADEILEFSHAHDRKLYRAALDAVAQARKLRPVFMERQPKADRHTAMIATLSRPGMEMAADSLIRNWLLKKQTAMLADFMDALKVEHENGVVNALPKTVDDVLLGNAVESLLAKHPALSVALYLHAFNGMNAENWANLESLLNSDPRLQIA